MNNLFEEEKYDNVLDALISYIQNLPKSTVKLLNLERYKLMMATAAHLTELLKKSYSEGELDIDIDTTFNMGSISIELESLTISDPVAFANLIHTADNFEVYPLTNGNVRLSIAFRSVLKSIA